MALGTCSAHGLCGCLYDGKGGCLYDGKGGCLYDGKEQPLSIEKYSKGLKSFSRAEDSNALNNKDNFKISLLIFFFINYQIVNSTLLYF